MGLLAVLAAVTLIVFIQNLGKCEASRRKNKLPFIWSFFIDEILLSIQEVCIIGVIIIMFYGFEYFADKAAP